MSEHDEQVGLFQFLETIRAQHEDLQLLYAIPNGGHMSKAQAGKLKAEGVKSGVWDLHLPVGSHDKKKLYIGLWIEMKFGKNKLTPNQKTWQGHMEHHGHKCVVCYTWIDAVQAISEYLNLNIKIRSMF